MHDGSGDDDSPVRVFKRMFSAGNRDAVLRGVHVAVDDVVFAADENT